MSDPIMYCKTAREAWDTARRIREQQNGKDLLIEPAFDAQRSRIEHFTITEVEP